MWRRSKRRDMADVNMYTASRLGEMARSLSVLAKSCQDDLDNKRGLTKEDALAAMQMSAAMVCGDCGRCNLYNDSEKDGSYYLHYLLRTFEQKGQIEYEDMPRFFLETCRRREDYLAQLNHESGVEEPFSGKQGYGDGAVSGAGCDFGGVCPSDGAGVGYYGAEGGDSEADVSSASHAGGESAAFRV